MTSSALFAASTVKSSSASVVVRGRP
ncbi:unnamed protein product, partial [Rotaria sp. Silwood1]